MQVNR